MTNITHDIDIVKIEGSIKMLKTYLKDSGIEPLLSMLEELKNDAGNESILVRISDVLNELGTTKGAILTYAPYIAIILPDDPFEKIDRKNSPWRG